ncbi:MAG: carboxypeptidase-like regulatory domain-containing protein [Acidimicrobiales bacterium]
MKARHVIVIGLAVLATACSNTTLTLPPSSTTPTFVSSTTTSTTVNQTPGKPPPVPHCYYTGSGYGTCEGYVIPMPGTVILFTHPDKDGIFKLTGPAPLQTKVAVACGDAGCVYNHLDWASSYGGGVSDAVNGTCQSNTTVCNVSVPPGLQSWTPVFVRQNNNPAILYLLWNSGKPGAVISGYVLDKTQQAVQGATVSAQGAGGGSSPVDPTTGLYAINVKAGDYNVAPSGGPSGIEPPRFDPESLHLSVQAGATAHADFTLNGGLKVTLTFSQASVSADGLSVVKGEIETTEYGKPDGGVTVTLRPKPSETGEAAVTSGALATICGSTGTRIWPTGSVLSPFATPVDVVTNVDGIYDFTMTIGTVPGTFPLNAWAKNAAGDLITADLRDASPDQTLTVTPPGNWTVDQFLSELDGLKSDAAASQVLAAMTNDPASITQALSQLSGPSSKLGGLAYSLVAGAHGGYAVLIYPDTSPPEVTSTGEVVGNDHTLVLSPDDWVGTKLVSITALNVVIQKGLLSAVPTFPQWAHGEAVPGWQLTTNTASSVSEGFQYFGWPYPSTEAGACS